MKLLLSTISHRARQEYAAFQQLLSLVLNLLTQLIESLEEEWVSIAHFVGTIFYFFYRSFVIIGFIDSTMYIQH